jgi:hypothetical protein
MEACVSCFLLSLSPDLFGLLLSCEGFALWRSKVVAGYIHAVEELMYRLAITKLHITIL